MTCAVLSAPRSAPPPAPLLDTKALRQAFGQFATGVTVVTTRDKQGRALGMTANSFTSVSLDPPLVLWCLARNSANLQAYREARHFAINVLTVEQHALCNRFARRIDGDRFEGVPLADSRYELPLIDGAMAQFECSKWAEHEVGDHIMFIGRVENFTTVDGDALIFNAGRFFSGQQLPTTLAG